jgi:hypothetical protein
MTKKKFNISGMSEGFEEVRQQTSAVSSIRNDATGANMYTVSPQARTWRKQASFSLQNMTYFENETPT